MALPRAVPTVSFVLDGWEYRYSEVVSIFCTGR
jgi:hypothetical protein